MKKLFTLMLLASTAMGAMAHEAVVSEKHPAVSRAEAPAAITTQPAGTLKLMQRDCMAYRPYASGYAYDAPVGGTLLNVVFSDDNCVYFQNWITFDNPGLPVWIKGEIQGDSVVMTFPQIGYQEKNAAGDIISYNLYVMGTDEANQQWTPEIVPNQTMVFDYKDGRLTQRGDGIIAMGEPNAFYGYGEYHSIIAPIEGNPVEAPEGADWTEMSLVNEIGGGRYEGTQDGYDVYVGGLCAAMPQAVIKGTISQDATSVTIPSNQFMGADWASRTAYYMMATSRTGEYDQDYQEWRYEYEFQPSYKINFNIDDWKAVSADSAAALLVNGGNISPNPTASYANFVMSYQPDYGKPVQPATPIITYYYEYDADNAAYVGGPGYMEVTIPVTDINGNLLDMSKLYYNVLVDKNEPYTFDKDSYPAEFDVFSTEITNIPANFTSPQPKDAYKQPIFQISGQRHSMVLPFQAPHVGIQTLYVTDGVTTKSNAYYWGIGEVGIQNVEAAPQKAASTIYYDLQGRKVANPDHGFYIMKQGAKAAKIIR